MEKNKSENKLDGFGQSHFSQKQIHGAKADLTIGDFIETDLNSNFGQNKKAKYT
jgi:hypothetical protein